jgi:hypothetical protein
MSIFSSNRERRENVAGMVFALGMLLILAIGTPWIASRHAPPERNVDPVWLAMLIGGVIASVLADVSVALSLWNTHDNKRKHDHEARQAAKDLAGADANDPTRQTLLDQKLRDALAKWRIEDRSANQWLLLLNMLFVLELTIAIAVALPVGSVAFLIAMVPLLIVAYHASNLSVDAPRFPELFGNSEIAAALEGQRSNRQDSPDVMRNEAARNEAARNEAARNVGARLTEAYSVPALLLRYWLPAVVLVGVGLANFISLNYLTKTAGASSLPPGFRDGVEGAINYFSRDAFIYGLVGAYLYVYLQLIRRSVRNDVTPMVILWCLLTLSIGPVVAGLLPSLLGQSQGTLPSPSADAEKTAVVWTTKALWLFAGYSPRFVVDTLTRAIASSLRAETRGIEQETRVPLGRIQGIGAEEAERLAEEGITEAHGLASVDPLRLMRDTRFDNWRILSWVDQSLLVSTLPEELCKKLQKRGIWGATDLDPDRLKKEQKEEIDAHEQQAIDRLHEDARVGELSLLVKLVRYAGSTGSTPALSNTSKPTLSSELVVAGRSAEPVETG